MQVGKGRSSVIIRGVSSLECGMHRSGKAATFTCYIRIQRAWIACRAGLSAHWHGHQTTSAMMGLLLSLAAGNAV